MKVFFYMSDEVLAIVIDAGSSNFDIFLLELYTVMENSMLKVL